MLSSPIARSLQTCFKRAPADAIEQCFTALAKKHSPHWILKGDIRAAFD